MSKKDAGITLEQLSANVLALGKLTMWSDDEKVFVAREYIVKELRKMGYSYGQIAKVIGVNNRSTVQYYASKSKEASTKGGENE